jgi:hypothetical protein
MQQDAEESEQEDEDEQEQKNDAGVNKPIKGGAGGSCSLADAL